MGFIEVLVVGLALSADAFAVTISNTFVYATEPRKRLALMPCLFGLFQGLMLWAGYIVGGLAADLIEAYSGIVTLVILGFIGINMVHEGLSSVTSSHECEPDAGPVAKRLKISSLLVQAFATSIDAFAVGVSLRASEVSIYIIALSIALITALCCVVALVMGHKLGHVLGDRAQVVGGMVLILIGLKAFFL